MKVELKVKLDVKYGTYPEPAPEELYSAEMEPEEFALKVATVFQTNPELKKESQQYVLAPVFALIFGQDPERFRGRKRQQLELNRSIFQQPECVKVNEVCDGKLIHVSIGPREMDQQYFFRVSESGLKYIPCAEECLVGTTSGHHVAFAPGHDHERYEVKPGDPAWPWLAFYPEKFAGLIEFAEILNPGDENPLTGLVSTKDAPVRTLAKQLASKITRARDQWVCDIVDQL